MEVLEIKHAIAQLRQKVEAVVPTDSYERAISAEYQMMINSLEELLAEVEAPYPNVEKLTVHQNESQRILKTIHHRVIERLTETARSISSGAPLDEFLKPQANLAEITSTINYLSKKIVDVAYRRAAKINSAPRLESQHYPRQNSPALSAQESIAQYPVLDVGAGDDVSIEPESKEIDVTEVVTDLTRQLGNAIEGHLESKDVYLPILQQLVRLSLHLIMPSSSDAAAPPRGPVDTSSKRADDDGMDARITALEKDVAAIKVDVAVVKANGATKSDVAETKAAISEAKTAIILWVAGVVILAQVVPAVLKLIPQ